MNISAVPLAADDLDPHDDAAWAKYKAEWSIRGDTTYLNHGSFGPPPHVVRQAQLRWQQDLAEQPMDFFVRKLEPALLAAREKLAAFVGTAADNLVFIENATAGMNIVADAFRLQTGDEVLLTDHEYGAVRRIWQRACDRVGAQLKTAELPLPFRSVDDTVTALWAAVTPRTRLIVVSHITSPTAVILPVAQIGAKAREQGIAVAVDGPHALAQLPLTLDTLNCDFYTVSCHKWLSAPFGSGFLYVAPPHQQQVRAPVLSWGRIPPTPLRTWSDEFVWSGTREPSAYLSVPTAIEFLERIGLSAFRRRTHALAQYARQRLIELTGLTPIVPDDPAWYGTMAHVPLPPPPAENPSHATERPDESCPVANRLQHTIWQQLGIEVPVVEFKGTRYIRVSCHLYNDRGEIDRLVAGLRDLLAAGH